MALFVIAVVVLAFLATCQASQLYGLANCKTLVPGMLNLHYQVDPTNTYVDMALEGVVDKGDQYLSFGYAEPGASYAKMVGGNVVVGMWFQCCHLL